MTILNVLNANFLLKFPKYKQAGIDKNKSMYEMPYLIWGKLKNQNKKLKVRKLKKNKFSLIIIKKRFFLDFSFLFFCFIKKINKNYKFNKIIFSKNF